MSDLHITVSGTKRLLTAGKRHEKNIVITAQGGDSHYDTFWDAYQKKGIAFNYSYAFSGGGWTDAIYNPKYEIYSISNAVGMFMYNGSITTTKVPITIDAENQNCTSIFVGAYALKTIPSIKVTEKVRTFHSWFSECYALEEINFTQDSVIQANISFQDSPRLTTPSVNSIIHALKDLTGQTSLTVTFHAEVGAKLTQEQKATITAKNWTLVY